MMPKALDGTRSSKINYTFVPGEQRFKLYSLYYRIANLFHVSKKKFSFTNINNTVNFYFTVSSILIAVMSYHLLLVASHWKDFQRLHHLIFSHLIL